MSTNNNAASELAAQYDRADQGRRPPSSSRAEPGPVPERVSAITELAAQYDADDAARSRASRGQGRTQPSSRPSAVEEAAAEYESRGHEGEAIPDTSTPRITRPAQEPDAAATATVDDGEDDTPEDETEVDGDVGDDVDDDEGSEDDVDESEDNLEDEASEDDDDDADVGDEEQPPDPFAGESPQFRATLARHMQQASARAQARLQERFGGELAATVSHANYVLQKFGSPRLRAALRENPVLADADFVHMLSRVGRHLRKQERHRA